MKTGNACCVCSNNYLWLALVVSCSTDFKNISGHWSAKLHHHDKVANYGEDRDPTGNREFLSLGLTNARLTIVYAAEMMLAAAAVDAPGTTSQVSACRHQVMG